MVGIEKIICPGTSNKEIIVRILDTGVVQGICTYMLAGINKDKLFRDEQISHGVHGCNNCMYNSGDWVNFPD